MVLKATTLQSCAGRSTLSHQGSWEGLSPEGCGPMVTQAIQPPLNIVTLERRPHVSIFYGPPEMVLEPKVSNFSINEVQK